MKHVHLEECASTQDILRQMMAEDRGTTGAVLVSTSRQTRGHGRSGNAWSHLPQALAFSFSLAPNPDSLPLTSLELAVLVAQYLEKRHGAKILLKWPNDLLDARGLKCGGILCQGPGGGLLAVGIGINFGESGRSEPPGDEFKSGLGSLLPGRQLLPGEDASIPLEIYEHVLASRMGADEIVERWKERCAHWGAPVEIEEQGQRRRGTFVGLGPHGEALVDEAPGGARYRVFSGNLNFYLRD